MSYAKYISRNVPQSVPLPGQVKNKAGGYVYKIDKWDMLHRFLVLGSEGGTFYTGERELTIGNANCVVECLAENPGLTLKTIVDISIGGRAPKNDPAIFALAIACSTENIDTRRCAVELIQDVCRTGTHLFQFVEEVTKLRGWGSTLRRGISHWYTTMDPGKLAYQVTKYQNRNGWSHRDLLRLSHPYPDNAIRNAVMKWALSGFTDDMASWDELRVIVGLEKCKRATTVEEVVSIINDYKLSWEMVPTVWQKETKVWEALIPNMPLMALLRHLGKFSSMSMLGRNTPELEYVVKQLTDKEYIHKSRLHPMSILVASTTYAQGHGVKGSLTWSPNKYLIDAMDNAFELAFANVEPSGKRLLVGIDVSGSMGWGTCGSSIITARTAAAAMAMITVRTEPRVGVMAFSHQFEKFPISDTESLNSVVSRMEGMNYGNTDCALPMIYATQNKMDIDGFVVITDNDTWSGSVHPQVALANYREKFNPEARSVVMGMTATELSIANPKDKLSLDVVGLDTSTPQVVSDFIAGRI